MCTQCTLGHDQNYRLVKFHLIYYGNLIIKETYLITFNKYIFNCKNCYNKLNEISFFYVYCVLMYIMHTFHVSATFYWFDFSPESQLSEMYNVGKMWPWSLPTCFRCLVWFICNMKRDCCMYLSKHSWNRNICSPNNHQYGRPLVTKDLIIFSQFFSCLKNKFMVKYSYS